MTDGRAPAWIRERPIAHRGLHDAAPGVHDAPENSLPAFVAAADHGYPIELDVRLLSDGHVAVFHDPNTGRMTGEARPIASMLRGDLPATRLRHTAHRIPLLAEALEAIGGRVPIVVELKTRGGEVGPLERATWRELARYRGEYAVQSFNPIALGFFRMHAPHVPRGQLAYSFVDQPTVAWRERWLLRSLLYNSISAPDYVAYYHRELPHWAATRARESGVPLLAWTIRDQDEWASARARDLADNVIFEGFLP